MSTTPQRNRNKRPYLVKISADRGLHHFGMDSEGTGREEVNLLSSPVRLSFDGDDWASARWMQDPNGNWECSIPATGGDGLVRWRIESTDSEMTWTVNYEGSEQVAGLLFEMELGCLEAASSLLPSALDGEGRGLGPWLLASVDFGHLVLDAESDLLWTALNEGKRAGWFGRAPECGVDPSLRGKDWIEAAKIPGYIPGKICLQIKCEEHFYEKSRLVLRFASPAMKQVDGIDPDRWQEIRRAYLSSWQPCGTWSEKDMVWVLANNVLSDPGSCSLIYYAEPMLFCQEPVEGFDMLHLLKHSLDYWIGNHVSTQGHVNAFRKMYDLYPISGCSLINSGWIYWKLSQDREWLNKNLPWMHLMADYLLRRDVDGDGLLEDYLSGVPGRLRDPERANIWFEYVNFGHKNAYFNALAYRSLMCIADMFEAADGLGPYNRADPKDNYRFYISRAGASDPPASTDTPTDYRGANATATTQAAAYYRAQAEKLRTAFRTQLLGPNGWIVGWVDASGDSHDYCHTFINGMAVAYGLVTPDEGREILERVVKKSKSIGFENWHLGVPANLIPIARLDMIQSRMGINGVPLKDQFHWPDDLSEEEAFGYRYTNGTIHPHLTWYYILGLQVAGLNDEADRILDAMIGAAKKGLFTNGIVNANPGGAEHFFINGMTCGYEGYLPESYNFLMAAFTRDAANREKLLGVLHPEGK